MGSPITVTVVEARGLSQSLAGEQPDRRLLFRCRCRSPIRAATYVELTYGSATDRTSIVRGSPSPQWGHSSSLTFAAGEDLTFSVWEVEPRAPAVYVTMVRLLA